MQKMNKFEILSTRDNFNAVVRHVKAAVSMSGDLAGKKNLADLLMEVSSEQELSGEQLSAFLHMLLIDKMGYSALSRNLESLNEDFASIAKEVSTWNAVDLVLAYHHPDIGMIVVNPKNPDEMKNLASFRKRELMVIYAGYFDKKADPLCAKAADTLVKLVEGKKCTPDKNLYTGNCTFKKVPKKLELDSSKSKPVKKASKSTSKGSAKKTSRGGKEVAVSRPPRLETASQATVSIPAPVASASRRMTPMYSVVVSNELFHNGNVEAWKRIIASYKAKHPDLEVYIYYDGERIIDINSLFKWGKVKHGSSIQFAVAGSEIKDVAKLQRYLSQGASHMFEAFLHGSVSTVLKLF